MLDLRALEVFYWVATLRSFRGAAARLNTTQPSVSLRIQQLEAQVGARLLDRNQRTVQATDKGRELLVHAEKLLKLHGQMFASIVEPQALVRVLRLGVAETIVQTWLPSFIARLGAAYPQIALEIDVDISANLRDRLVGHELDLAFLLGPISTPQARNLALSSYPLGFFASPSLAFPPAPVSLAAIARYPIITFARRTAPYMALVERMAAEDVPAYRIHASAALAPALRMAIEGLGVALVPRAIVSREIEAGVLREIEADVHVPDLAFTASWTAAPDAPLIERIAALAVEAARQGDFKDAR
ncbi:MAG: LysR family transcriptional regulator [Beijerinckiaceae bacterium]